MELGPKGLIQTFADILKLLQKESIVHKQADKWVFLVAPVLIFVAIFAGFVMVPLAPQLIGSEAAVGVYYLLAIVSLDVIGMLLAGWSSNNKYSVLGAMRAIAQVISYEIPVTFCVLAVVMICQSVDLMEISYQQGLFTKETSMVAGEAIPTVYLFGIKSMDVNVAEYGILAWNIFRFPLLFIGMIIYFVSTLAESNRAPFDLPEAESEIIAGIQTEYGGFRWSLIMLGEYAMMLLVAMLGVVLFLGSWNTPLPNLGSVKLASWTSGVPGEMSGYLWGIFWILSKSLVWVVAQIWMRWTYPRLRIDQLMYLCWKVLIPMTLVIVFAAGAWRLLMV